MQQNVEACTNYRNAGGEGERKNEEVHKSTSSELSEFFFFFIALAHFQITTVNIKGNLK